MPHRYSFWKQCFYISNISRNLRSKVRPCHFNAYVAWGAEQSCTGREEKEIREYLIAQLKEDHSCFSKLWDEAASWAASREDVVGSWHFKNWWTRAAFARGHAEWLIKERNLNSLAGNLKPI